MALAWMAEEDEKCPGCHRQWVETTDPEAFEDYDATAIVCFACAERERAGVKFRDDSSGSTAGVYIAVHKREE